MNGSGYKRKIGILGGTFDPIHRGHISLALTAVRHFTLDEVWLMPNGAPPHKENSHIIADPGQRLEMTELAIADAKETDAAADALRTCDYEVKREEKSYSYATMEAFRTLYPDCDFYFIIGADSLLALTTWMKPERLLAACTLLVAVRDDSSADTLERTIRSYEAMYEPCDIRILPMSRIDISSTEIRQRAAAGQDLVDLVTPSVARYISSHPEIYGGSAVTAGEQS